MARSISVHVKVISVIPISQLENVRMFVRTETRVFQFSLLYNVPVQKRVRVPNESGHEVRHDPDTLASSPDRYKGR
jgi:hypothetical protein